jgi:hypothetical protein
MWIYPENYEVPEKPTPSVLSPQQRTAVKNKMKTYLNNSGKPMLVKELAEDALSYIMTTYDKHINIDVLVDIAVEIREEYGVPVVEEEIIE